MDGPSQVNAEECSEEETATKELESEQIEKKRKEGIRRRKKQRKQRIKEKKKQSHAVSLESTDKKELGNTKKRKRKRSKKIKSTTSSSPSDSTRSTLTEPPEKKQKTEFVSEMNAEVIEGKYGPLIMKWKKVTLSSKWDDLKDFFRGILEVMQTRFKEKIRDSEQVKRMNEIEVHCARLFELLTNRKLPKWITEALEVIKRKLLMQSFTEAEAEYIQLWIGNATWQSKAVTKNAVVKEYSNELLAVKRLMTYFQEEIYPLFVSVEALEDKGK